MLAAATPSRTRTRPAHAMHDCLFHTALGDGRPALYLLGLCLSLAGCFAIFQASTGEFLPQDAAFLGMSAADLCAMHECRIVHFMIHDRVSFGGTLIATGLLYLWLTAFPLSRGERWAWWTLLGSAMLGFTSFLSWLGYGYLDTWHAVATLALAPVFVLGMWRSRVLLRSNHFERRNSWRDEVRRRLSAALRTRYGFGWLLLCGTSAAITVAGLVILGVGMTCVFVPQDLEFLQLSPTHLQEINGRLIALIAHDRAAFGGGLACGGLAMFLALWFSRPAHSLWQVLALAGIAGFSSAILVHPAIGYNDFLHLAPAYLGAVLWMAGLICTRKQMWQISA